MDLVGCQKRGFVKTVKPDINKTKALRTIATKKAIACEMLPNDLAEPKVTLIYDAIRIMLESIALNKGYKIYNHECYTAFLKEIANESRLGDEFDSYRKIRNAINYYGKELGHDEANELLARMKGFLCKLEALIL